MQEDLTRAKESEANMATTGQKSHVVTEPVGTTKKRETPEPEPVVEEALQTGTKSAKVIKTLREELAAQEALREKEWEQRKLAEDERRRMEEGLRKVHANNDRLKKERDKLQQEKDKNRTSQGRTPTAKGSGRPAACSSKPTLEIENR